MRKLLYTILFILFIGNCFATPAKWSKQDNWRQIKHGMPEQAVINILGKSKFSETTSEHLTMYYSMNEPEMMSDQYNKNIIIDQIDLKFDGAIKFKKVNKIFKVSSLIEPDFTIIATAETQTPKKKVPNPKNQLQKWHIEKNWKRLKIDMPEQAVVNILGEPDNKSTNGASTLYAYGKGSLGGNVKFLAGKVASNKSNIISSWKEPFWYLLNKGLYEEVEETIAETTEETKTTE